MNSNKCYNNVSIEYGMRVWNPHLLKYKDEQILPKIAKPRYNNISKLFTSTEINIRINSLKIESQCIWGVELGTGGMQAGTTNFSSVRSVPFGFFFFFSFYSVHLLLC